MMMLSLLLSAVVVVCSGEIDSFTEDSGTCIGKCSPGRCAKYDVDSHPCSGASKTKISINPWMCGQPRCEDTDCSRCGDFDHCVSLCTEKRMDLQARGFDMSGWKATFGCRKACAQADDEEWMCFQDCDPASKDDTGKPMCYDYWPCSEQFCSRKGKQKCYAMDIAVDPWNFKQNECKISRCSRCGNQDLCLQVCDDFNNLESTSPKVDCRAQCQSVSGYKCIFTPPSRSEIEEMEALEEEFVKEEWVEVFGEESWWAYKLAKKKAIE